MPDKQELLILLAVLGLAWLLIPIFAIRHRPRRLAADAEFSRAAGVPPEFSDDRKQEDYAPLPAEITSSPYAPPLSVIQPKSEPAGIAGSGGADGRWFDWRDGVIALALLAFLSFLLGPLPMVAMTMAKESGAKAPEVSTGGISKAAIAANLIFQFFIIAAVIFYLSKMRGKPLSRVFGLKHGGFLKVAGSSILGLLAGIGLVFVGAILSSGIQYALGGKLEPQPAVKMLTNAGDPVLILLMIASAAIAAPIQEELVFRGYFFGAGKRYLGKAGAITVTALFFGVIHNNLLSLVPLTLLGVLFAVAYDRSRNLLVPIFIHALFNGLQMAAMLNGWTDAP